MVHPFPLFESIWTPSREIAVTPDVTEALKNGATVAIGVSGGKDSAAAAFATTDYLNEMGHQGPRVLIHSDLGRVEWRQSLSVCERLAPHSLYGRSRGALTYTSSTWRKRPGASAHGDLGVAGCDGAFSLKIARASPRASIRSRPWRIDVCPNAGAQDENWGRINL